MQKTDGVKTASQTQVDLPHLICSPVKAHLCVSSAAASNLMNTAGFAQCLLVTGFIQAGIRVYAYVCE